ncbi:glycosyltransferase family 2 protein [Paraglaciecola sp.]|uniref:glycosyltransferase family 2 protein n=1 Tax=Paraglaciecola sp. TaxID=1920173 RepID=UPI00326376E7
MKVAILMMQKNESELLDKWLRYHGYLFGFDNLYVYDNGSEDKAIRETLQDYQPLGVNVDLEHNQKIDFENKGSLFLNKISQLQSERSDYDFYIPLDCDEFIGFLDDEGNVSCDKTGLDALLTQYIDQQDLLLFDSQYYNSSVSDVLFNKQPYRKCLFYKNTIASLDVGFHWGKVKNSDKEQRTRLIQFHFHNKPFSIGKEHAREKLVNRVKDFEPKTLNNYQGPGLHLVRFFNQSETSYVNNQLKQVHIHSVALRYKFNELGLSWPYEESLQESRNHNELVNELDGFSNITEYLQGSIDNIEYTKSTKALTVKGWAVFQRSVSVERLLLLIDKEKPIEFTVVKRVARKDVADMLNLGNTLIGIEAQGVLPASFGNATTFEIAVQSNHNSQVYPLNVNRKYREILSQ